MFPKRCATYRLQLNSKFGFLHTHEILNYLHDLGISHLYTSPFLQSITDSTHGYDIVDPTKINTQIGSDEDYEIFCRTVKEKGMGVLIDIVPNHMAISSSLNPWWKDVLEKGISSPYVSYFDIDWYSEKVTLPILEASLNEILERNEIKLVKQEDKFYFQYKEIYFPLNHLSIKDLADISKADLRKILDQQHYRFSFWQEAINYRRFFDIKDLIGLKVETESVFNATHILPIKWWTRGLVHGFRVDHPDGLLNPTEYLIRLKKKCPRAWVVVEKILQPSESLPSLWPIEGSTGYDFLNVLNSLWVYSKNESSFTRIYENFIGKKIDFEKLVIECKRQVLKDLFESELTWLSTLLHKIISRCHQEKLKNLIADIAVHFKVYRTYVTPQNLSLDDETTILEACQLASVDKNTEDKNFIRAIEKILLFKQKGAIEEEFAFRFQQLTGPVMAKGFEDTLLFRYNRLVSLNEVGGNPSDFGITLEEFHNFCSDVQKNHPYTLLASTTHDTKHSEDFRARLSLLSEIPLEFEQALSRWSKINQKYNIDDSNTEYLIYQTLIGAWPINELRLKTFLIKAMREAKVKTSWIHIDKTYESSVLNFASNLLKDEEFLTDFTTFLTPLIHAGRINSLSQTLVRLTAPGIPDIFQGSELWNLTLVDPDNRQPVDYEIRKKLLSEVGALSLLKILERMEEGVPKLWMIQQVLHFRREHPHYFSQGDYTPLYAEGKSAPDILTFMRADRAITVVSRFNVSSSKEGNLQLPGGEWVNLFSKESFQGKVPLNKLFAAFPVCFLIKV